MRLDERRRRTRGLLGIRSQVNHVRHSRRAAARTRSCGVSGHRGGGGVEPAFELVPDAAVDEDAGDAGLGGDLGQLELAEVGVLELGDGLAEGLALARKAFSVFYPSDREINSFMISLVPP
jgi:hypothetical protein